MSWIGYASLMEFFLGMLIVPKAVTVLAGPLGMLARLPWPWLGLFLGRTPGGEFSFSLGVVTCLAGSAAGLIAAVWFSVWGTQQGLSGNFAADRAPARSSLGAVAWSREPLYRKEFLWFARDRSAIVQAVLVPITLAGTQAFNLRGLLVHATGAWNYLCGLAILFGTYFLWVLGPKSLASEGTALWIPLTWPRGLESLLKAKAWLWSLISTGVVSLVLGFAVWMYPREFWKIALVGVAWFVFGRSLAEKSVTLVTVPSESGEVRRVSSGRRWGAQLGMLTFASGVLTEQWTVALVGIVYSWMTAAAMWQNFRAHLPYLYDPWSEVLPQPPTLMHAMISISALVELSAVLTGIATAMAGREHFGPAQAVSYAVCAVVVAFLVNRFLENRGVLPQEVWCWQARREEETDAEPWWKIAGLGNARGLRSLALGVVGGVLLGGFAQGYMAVLRHLPEIGEHFRKAQEQMAAMPELRWSYAVMAVLFAPFAEEYLFRGLLFRALDREWGGWRAVVGSAAFFAAYHPPRSWLPVGLLGAANALLFKKTGRLAPAVLLHMAYNAVVSL
jgi:membrane protease YdiL (CAAX protease family)